MKKNTLFFGVLPAFLMLNACNNAEKQDEGKNDTVVVVTDTVATTVPGNAAIFDPSSLPVSTADLGEYPYFALPDWVSDDTGYGYDKKSDFGKLEIYTKDGFISVEGKVFIKGYQMTNGGQRADWDEYRFVKSFSKHFESLGATKLFEGEVPDDAIEGLNKANNRDNYYYEFGTSSHDNLVTYGVQKDNKPIYFAISSNSAGGAIYVIEAEPFQQTIGIIKADKIEKDLAESGKSILYINFDTDKATLKTEGKDAINEIAKVLQKNKDLKLDVNGYTDNVGDADHNLQLSKDRANAVVASLIQGGIDKTRLAAKGFGANDFIADNSTEAGKEQNRRVELVKK
ncbi:OmpA family protein [Sphingobacterium lactis]|uniref:OmpA family protein n=1 Tax=Sphingobacterium lactis TaxID=797291 RepID=UPI003EC584A4